MSHSIIGSNKKYLIIYQLYFLNCSLLILINYCNLLLAITPYHNQRFINGLKSPNVRRISIRDNHFVLINSMGLEGDGCFLCRPTEIAVNKIASELSLIFS
jgi:hypothetical protein